jgi:polyphosphate kinase 2 (PPK2 family)
MTKNGLNPDSDAKATVQNEPAPETVAPSKDHPKKTKGKKKSAKQAAKDKHRDKQKSKSKGKGKKHDDAAADRRVFYYPQESEGSSKLPKKFYEKELARLQVELVKMQYWVKHAGARIVIIFEGRDAAGKGGTIKRITDPLNPAAAGWSHWERLAIAKKLNGIFNAMWPTYPPRERLSCFDRSPGTTGRGWSM